VFFLTIFLVGMTCFLGDFLMEYYRFTFNRNASDYVRGLMGQIRKIGIRGELKNLEIEDDEMMELSGILHFMKPIE
jgi:hypothetical protein